MNIENIKLRYDIIGNDPKLLLALNKAIQVAPTDLSILITGESGVGKDVFSRIIHENSLRKHVRQGKGLIAVNCGAIPEGTIESELFGHVKGAFTGADKNRKGYFEEADGGTIFLDEIGELPLAMQVKLLRVLENGEIMPVGSSTAQKINVRVVAATNIDIVEADGECYIPFQTMNDLLINDTYMQYVFDGERVLGFFYGCSLMNELDSSPKHAMSEAFARFNYNELCLLLDCKYGNITPAILQNYLNYVPSEKMPALVDGHGSYNPSTITDRELLLKALSMGQMINEMRSEINDLRQAVAQLAQGLPATHQPMQTLPQATYFMNGETNAAKPKVQPEDMGDEEEFLTPEVIEDEPIALIDRERKAIEQALKNRNGNRKLAADDLSISERTLYRKLKNYNMT